ncbi:MAG: Spy/CpxP family protein refolding chaperone [Steroidobacteraceae bacterium]
MKRKLVIGAVAALAIGALTVGFAREHGPGGHGGGDFFGGPGMFGPQMLERLGDKLELSDEQKTSIRGLMDSARPNMEQMRDALRNNMQRLHDTAPDSPDYNAVVASVSGEAAELARRFVTDSSQLRAQVWAVLTPEQRAKAQQLRDEWQAKREERRSKWQKRREQRDGAPPAGGPPPAS